MVHGTTFFPRMQYYIYIEPRWPVRGKNTTPCGLYFFRGPGHQGSIICISTWLCTVQQYSLRTRNTSTKKKYNSYSQVVFNWMRFLYLFNCRFYVNASSRCFFNYPNKKISFFSILLSYIVQKYKNANTKVIFVHTSMLKRTNYNYKINSTYAFHKLVRFIMQLNCPPT